MPGCLPFATAYTFEDFFFPMMLLTVDSAEGYLIDVDLPTLQQLQNTAMILVHFGANDKPNKHLAFVNQKPIQESLLPSEMKGIFG